MVRVDFRAAVDVFVLGPVRFAEQAAAIGIAPIAGGWVAGQGIAAFRCAGGACRVWPGGG
ncbi:hypothetical protein D9M73_241450 [compost metagenome]